MAKSGFPRKYNAAQNMIVHFVIKKCLGLKLVFLLSISFTLLLFHVGYRGRDCSVDISKPPTIEDILTEKCMLASKTQHCSRMITMTVSNVILTDTINCHVTYVKVKFAFFQCLL